MNIKARLSKLERAGSTSDIPVWCDNEADVPATIVSMLAGNEVTKADLAACVFRSLANARHGAHDAALIELA